MGIIEIQDIFKERLFYYFKLSQYPKVGIWGGSSRGYLRSVKINFLELQSNMKNLNDLEWYLCGLFSQHLMKIYKRTNVKRLRESIEVFLQERLSDQGFFASSIYKAKGE